MRVLKLMLATLAVAAHSVWAAPEDFPVPQNLESAVNFWVRIYTEVDTDEGLIHDNLDLAIVYEKLEYPYNASSTQRRRLTDSTRDKYREILTTLAGGKRTGLSADERRVLGYFPDGVSASALRDAATRLRFQLGQADRFRAGLQRSGRYRPHIDQVLAERGLPPELAILPHVESSFDPTAYSRVGAAGLWQFTRATGLRYMRIDHIIDERRDPFIATYAAAQLLGDNFAVVESWPVALTAYNHGLAGMRRAIRSVGTNDIGVIVADYQGRSFGFASRNFYAAFAAALRVDSDPQAYFGDVALHAAEAHELVAVPEFVLASDLAAALDLPLRELQRLNPALMETVWEGDKYVPRNFELRLPARLAPGFAAAFDRIPGSARFASQRPDLYHRVQRGDTLSQIAERYGVGLSALIRANGLSNSHLIRIGQMLTLPVSGNVDALVAAAAAPESVAAAGPAVADATGRYTVRSGDSLDRISRRFGTSVEAILAANNIANARLIYPGQQLRIHTAADAAAPGAPAEPLRPAAAAATPSVDAAADASRVAAVQSPPAAAVASLTIPGLAPLSNGPTPLLPEAQALNLEVLANLVATEADAGTDADVAIDLSADPSDYSVSADGSIEVQALETLGHYADWLGIRTQRLRDLNGMAFGEAVILGQRIRLDFSTVDREAFEQRRMRFQQGIQESFFATWHIADVQEHVVRRGESLWVLAQQRYNVPVWLLRQYNPALDFDRIAPGIVVKFPTLRRIADNDA